MDDLACAIGFANRPVLVVGYSFGSWVAARHMKRIDRPLPCIHISPPNGMFDYPDMTPDPVRVVAGGADPFFRLKALSGKVPPGSITVVDSADHFWLDGEDRLSLILGGLIPEMTRQGA